MKSAIYVGPGNIEVREVPMPDCDDDGVVVKNLCAAICGSDVFSYAHDGSSVRIFPGGEFGHETVSRVVKVGRNVTDFAVGERVYPYPLYAKDDINRAGTIGGIAFLLPCVNVWLSCPSRRAYRSYKVLTPSGKT